MYEDGERALGRDRKKAADLVFIALQKGNGLGSEQATYLSWSVEFRGGLQAALGIDKEGGAFLAASSRQAYNSPMTALTKQAMTVEDFLLWADAQEGRWELAGGVSVANGPGTSCAWRDEDCGWKCYSSCDEKSGRKMLCLCGLHRG